MGKRAYALLALALVTGGAHGASPRATIPAVILDGQPIGENSELAANAIAAANEVDLAPPTVFREYDAGEVWTWGKDLLVSPKAANSRLIMYGYPISQLTWDKLADLMANLDGANLKVAIVSPPLGRGSGTATTDYYYLGSQMIGGSDDLANVTRYLALTAATNPQGNEIRNALSNAVALAYLKSAGVAVDSVPRLFLEDPSVTGFLAFSSPLADNSNYIAFVTENDGWDDRLSALIKP